jgi:hypothetical protein
MMKERKEIILYIKHGEIKIAGRMKREQKK